MENLAGLINVKVLLLAALIFIPVEQLLPMHDGQKVLRRAWLNDLVYALLNGAIVSFGLAIIITFVLITSNWLVPQGFKAMVAGQPYWLQLIEIIVLADLGFYAVHRLFHAIPALWRFHAVHHSIEEMDWLAAHRVHPLDQILTKGASLIPCFALGFSQWAIIAYFAIYHWHSLMLHANIRLNFGPLSWLVASPEFHHWHHSNRPEAHDKNFAGQIALWDFVFGTAHLPKGEKPGQYGTDEPVPAGYVDQIAYPFRSAPKNPPHGAPGLETTPAAIGDSQREARA